MRAALLSAIAVLALGLYLKRRRGLRRARREAREDAARWEGEGGATRPLG